MAPLEFIVNPQVIIRVVVGDNVATEIVSRAISVMLAGPDTHAGPQQNPTRCSPAQCLATEIVLCNNGFERSGREHGSMRQIAVNGADVSDRAFPATAGPTGGVDGLATQLDRLAGYAFGPTERSVQLLIPALGQQIRVSIRAGSGVPLVLCNGIGVGLEVLDPLVDQLDPNTTVVRFDVPGVGDSPNSPLPYSFPYLAAVLGRVLSTLGLGGEGIDVLGLSWGGALAQQFAFQNPRRCRRLILVSTGVGIGMVPGRPAVLAKLLTPRRFLDHDYAARIAGELYGGSARTDASIVKGLFDRQLMACSPVGYAHQLLAASVWSSLFALPLIRQPTLIVAGTDDPIIPVVNARIMGRLLPHATMHLHAGGHVDLVTNPAEFAPLIESFRKGERAKPSQRAARWQSCVR
jgi:poly(3-hydroxyalkanoate) depolymerase